MSCAINRSLVATPRALVPRGVESLAFANGGVADAVRGELVQNSGQCGS